MDLKKTRIVAGSSDVNRITGVNVGRYPWHHFTTAGGWPSVPPPVGILSAGWDEWVAGCYRKREKSTICALEYVTAGRFVFTREEQRYELDPGELFFVHLGEGSTMRCSTPRAQKRTIILFGTLLNNLMESLGLSRVDVIRKEYRNSLTRLFDCADTLCAGTDFRETSVFAYRMLLELSEISAGHGQNPLLTRVLEFLHQHLDRSVSVEDICHACGIGSATLYRLFASECNNVTPIEYHARLRMNRAVELLPGFDYSVKEVAAKLGFSSPQYFSTEFKRRFGYSPGNRSPNIRT